jgi:hypothetical protein
MFTLAYIRDLGLALFRHGGDCDATSSDGLPLYAEGSEQCLEPPSIVGSEVDVLKAGQSEGNIAFTVKNGNDPLLLAQCK